MMFVPSNVRTQLDLSTAIVPHPLTISPTARVADAIALMRGENISCDVDGESKMILAQVQHSCVLVLEDDRLVGIVTEWDLVRLSDSREKLAQMAIAEIAISSVVTLHIAEFTDLFVPLSLFQRHHIRHLPLVDDRGKVVGLLTHESLQQLLLSFDLLHLPTAAEVMTQTVVSAQPTAMLAELTQLMASHRVSSVAIVDTFESRVIPIGIVTERDIIQLLALELDFTKVQAQAVMSSPIVAVRSETSLWKIQQIMQQQQVDRVVVTDERGCLVGIVTQSELLQALNPMSIYRMAKLLMQEVSRAKQNQIERERLFNKIAFQIRSSLNLSEVLNTAVTELRALLQCDRLLIYQFEADWRGIVVAESVGEGWRKSLHESIDDPCFRKRVARLYSDGKKLAIDNIHVFGYPKCYLSLLEKYQVKANLVIPILVSGQLWGLSIAHQCDNYRHWQETDLSLLDEISVQLAIAIQQADAYTRLRVELSERQQIEARLRESEQFLRSIYEGVEQAIFTVDVLENGEFRYIAFNPAAEKLSGKSTEQIRGNSPEEKVCQQYTNCVRSGVPITYEECLFFSKTPTWWLTSLNPIRDDTGRIYRLVGISKNITQRKQAETLLEIQNNILERIAKAEPLPEILDALLRAMELQLVDAICSIMLCDREGKLHQGATTHLPEAYLREIEGISIGQSAGSCGTAAFRKQVVVVSDIATDPLWQNFKTLALEHGLLACWSMPVIASDDRVLGTFAVYHREIYTPNERELSVAALAANIAGIAIEREQETKALEQLNQELECRVEERTAAFQASEERWQLALKGTNDGICDWNLKTNKIFFSSRWKQIRGFADEEIGDSIYESLSRIHPDDCALYIESLGNHLAGITEFFEVEYRTRCKDGSYLWVLHRGQAIRNKSGEAIRFTGSDTEITLRKQAEEALRKSEYRYATLAASLPVAIFQMDALGQCFYVNERWSEMTGRPPEVAIGGRWLETLHPDDVERIQEQFSQWIQSSKSIPFQNEARILRPDGSVLWYYCQVIAEMDSFGNLSGYVGTLTDISDRKQAELALQESQRFIQQIAESSPNILYLYDIQQQHNVYANHQIFTILGYSPEEIQAMGEDFVYNLMYPDDLRFVLPVYYQRVNAAKDGEIIENEYRLRNANGEWRWLYSRDVVFSRDANGQVKQIIGTAQDMTERKRLEEEQNRLIAILQASTDYISMSDITGKIIWNNTALKQICGLERDLDVRKRNINDYHPQWAIEVILQQGLPTAIANGSWVGETALLDAEGQEIPLSQLIVAHKSPQGAVEFFSTIARDMRSRKEYEQRLERTNAELIRATRLKDEFLANMSHELRTPLNAILGMSEGLQEEVFGSINDRQRKAIATIEQSGQHLLALINDILEVSKIAAGKLELEISKVSVSALCTSSLTFVKQQALKKQIQLNAILPPDLGNIAVDERRMRQVLINLLSNAVKFTPSGGRVTLEAFFEPDRVNLSEKISLNRQSREECRQWENYYLCIAVTDTGIGIADADRPKLFQPFVQIDSSLNRQYEGTGLGLTLVKQIVELHGGSISVTSALGRGSCFTVSLPCRLLFEECATPISLQMSHATPESALTTSESSAAPTRSDLPLILLAEDNQNNMEILCDYLEAKGYRLLLAKNGEETIALIQIHSPDLILMDIQMPKIDGLQAIQTIRQELKLVRVPIVVLTALAMEGDRERCLAAGANDYFAKPFKLKELAATIQQLLD